MIDHYANCVVQYLTYQASNNKHVFN